MAYASKCICTPSPKQELVHFIHPIGRSQSVPADPINDPHWPLHTTTRCPSVLRSKWQFGHSCLSRLSRSSVPHPSQTSSATVTGMLTCLSLFPTPGTLTVSVADDAPTTRSAEPIHGQLTHLPYPPSYSTSPSSSRSIQPAIQVIHSVSHPASYPAIQPVTQPVSHPVIALSCSI